MAKVNRTVRVTVEMLVIDDDDKKMAFGMSADAIIPRGAKLDAHGSGLAVARAASGCLDTLSLGVEVALKARKREERRNALAAALTDAESVSNPIPGGAPDVVDAPAGGE